MSSLDPVTQINVPLLRKTLEYAEDHPEEINLFTWASVTSCGTTACIAGTAVLLAGHEIDWESANRHGEIGLLVDGRRIETVAADELGLVSDGRDAFRLFTCESLSRVWMVAEELTNGEIQRPVK